MVVVFTTFRSDGWASSWVLLCSDFVESIVGALEVRSLIGGGVVMVWLTADRAGGWGVM